VRIGVTGIYASGKETVCELFQQLGAIVIDTDLIARDIVAPGTEGLRAIIHEFGDSFVASDGTLNRRKLARYVFPDVQKTQLLNSITHPLILEKTLALSEREESMYMINTPLLFESGFDTYMDAIIVVTASEEEVIQRGQKRDNLSYREIKDRLKSQISLNEEVKKADYTINNSSTLENTRKQVEEIWKILTKTLINRINFKNR
jgi:dephospho-CoA kinase